MHVHVETFWGNLKFANGYIIILLTFLNEYHALSVQSTETTLSYSYTQNPSKPKKVAQNQEKYTLLKKNHDNYKLNVKLRKCFDLLLKRTENYYVTLLLLL